MIASGAGPHPGLNDHTILTFHGVGPVSRPMDDGERECWLERKALEALLDLVRGLAHVQLTFDDGNRSDVEIALPALLARGLVATFFVCSGRLHQPSFLSREHLLKLRASGMAVGSHGVAHIPWRKLAAPQLCDELQTSRRVLESACAAPVDAAACPFGAYDRTVLAALRRAGYRRAYTSDGGASAENQWLQARTTITRGMLLKDATRLILRPAGRLNQRLAGLRRLIKRLR